MENLDLLTPLIIFFARLVDVSIGTVRIMFVIRGQRILAAFLGFIEVTIWLLAVSAVVTNVTENYLNVVGYSGGFAAGTLVGMWIESRLALGEQLIRVVNIEAHKYLAAFLRERGYLVTEVQGKGAMGAVEIVFLIVPRKKSQTATAAILEYCPRAFLTIEDVRSIVGGTSLFKTGGATAPSELTWWRRLVKKR
ncbi:MAG: DUF5698 domain-containing protein [Sumerlaeia bacterium]